MNRFEKPPRSYASDLERAVFETPLADTHEHLFYEKAWIESKCDVLRDLLNNYVEADLRVAGADRQAIERALNAEDPDIEGRLTGILPALEKSRFTGYGEMVYLLARVVYGIEELTADALKNAQPILDGLMQPGERLRLLRDVAGLDHAQTDDFVWACLPDSSGPDFFFMIFPGGISAKEKFKPKRSMPKLALRFPAYPASITPWKRFSRNIPAVQSR
ncbi:MAG: hypothetical protein UZ16_OP3001000989 [Candidatus Hinthialibacteria bacterium OLB16]|nr:MAG: hypothetical protein UZ16_OP3001000989 [Candidatus Hinthialibacteria bacterium OLB16]